jgi:hypothetical protein
MFHCLHGFLLFAVFVVEKSNNIFILGIWLAFEPEVWPVIILLIAIISLLFKIIISRSTLTGPLEEIRKLNLKQLSLSFYMQKRFALPQKKPALVRMFEALEITLQPLLGQPLNPSQISYNPRRLLKLLLIIWWFSCLIITTLYSTSLITSLINPVRPREAESLQDLIDFGYRFKLENNQGPVYELIASVPETVQEDLSVRAEPDPSKNVTDDHMKTIKLLRMIKERLIVNDTTNYKLVAYIVEESAVKTIHWGDRNIGFGDITIIRERLFLNGYGFPLKSQAAYKEKIDTALARLGASGLIDHWYTQTNSDHKQAVGNKFRLRKKLSHVNLDLKILQGAFIFLMIGCTFSGLVFGLEHITKRYQFRFYSKQEIKRFLCTVRKYAASFYADHLAEKPPREVASRKGKEKFRKVASTIVKLNSRNPFTFVK